MYVASCLEYQYELKRNNLSTVDQRALYHFNHVQREVILPTDTWEPCIEMTDASATIRHNSASSSQLFPNTAIRQDAIQVYHTHPCPPETAS